MKTRKNLKLVCSVATAALVSACAAHEKASDMSGELLAQTMAYENQLVNLARVTEKQGERVGGWAKQQFGFVQSDRLDAIVLSRAEDTIESISRSGFSGKQIRSFIADYSDRVRENAVLVNTKLNEIDARSRKTVSALKKEIKPLASVRAKLEKLQQGLSFSDQVTALRPILELIKKTRKSNN